MNCIYRKAIVAIALLLSLSSFAQTEGLGTWDIIYGKYNFNKKWYAFFEPHLYSQKVKHDFSYYEYNLGVGYNLPKNVSVSMAVGHYVTYQSDGDFKTPLLNDEFRIWEQLSATNYIDRIKVEQRYRFEQRFTSSSGYRNRFRYRLNTVVPLNHNSLRAGTLYSGISDEIFITNETPFFEQNWLFMGMGYQLTGHTALQVGWLNRFNQTPAHVVFWKNYIQTSFLFTIDGYKK
jgi:hypothetical protein